MQKNHQRRQSQYFPKKITESSKLSIYVNNSNHQITFQRKPFTLRHTQLSPQKKTDKNTEKNSCERKKNIFFSKCSLSKSQNLKPPQNKICEINDKINPLNSMRLKEFSKQYGGYRIKQKQQDSTTQQIKKKVLKLQRKFSHQQKLNQGIKKKFSIERVTGNQKSNSKQILKKFEKKLTNSVKLQHSSLINDDSQTITNQRQYNSKNIYYLTKKNIYQQRLFDNNKNSLDYNDQSTTKTNQKLNNINLASQQQYNIIYKQNKYNNYLTSIKTMKQLYNKPDVEFKFKKINDNQQISLEKSLHQYINLVESFKKLAQILKTNSNNIINKQCWWYYRQYIRHRQLLQLILKKLYNKIQKSTKSMNILIFNEFLKKFQEQNQQKQEIYKKQFKKLNLQLTIKYDRKEVLKILNFKLDQIKKNNTNEHKKQIIKYLYDTIHLIHHIKDNKIQRYLQDIYF